MKNKGFTLIELLAVIVILAIIALIATPIILGIINDAREESNERSVELYAGAVKNAVARYHLNNANSTKAIEGIFMPTTGKKISNGYVQLVVDYDGNVDCELIKIYSDGEIYLRGCSVNNSSNKLNYGILKVTQEYKPQYYVSEESSGNVNEPPTNRDFYLGYDVTDNEISTKYVCFKINEIEYCLKGNDSNLFAINTNIIKEVYEYNGYNTNCVLNDTESYCRCGDLIIYSNIYGEVGVRKQNEICVVESDGDFICYEATGPTAW